MLHLLSITFDLENGALTVGEQTFKKYLYTQDMALDIKKSTGIEQTYIEQKTSSCRFLGTMVSVLSPMALLVSIIGSIQVKNDHIYHRRVDKPLWFACDKQDM